MDLNKAKYLGYFDSTISSTAISHSNKGYNSASNMRGEWNGVEALFLNDYSYAYYEHRVAH